MKSAAVDVLGVSKVFCGSSGAGLCALDKVTFSIPEGVIFGLLGANGSGKSTTIKLMLGLLQPTHGECRLGGLPARQPAARVSVGYAPESPRFPAHMNGRDVVIYFGKLSGMSGAKLVSQATRVLFEAGLESAANRRVANYSKGMLQRLGFAQALVHDPRLVILDEPASGLDPEAVEQLSARLLALKAEGKTVVLTSHHITQIGTVCDRIAVLDQGRLLLEEDVSALLANHPWQDLRVEKMPADQLNELQQWLVQRGKRMSCVDSATRMADALHSRIGAAKSGEHRHA